MKKLQGCINEEAIDAINRAAIDAIIAQRNPPYCFFILCFNVSIAPSINRLGFSSDFTISIISYISSFKINRVNLFPTLTAPSHLFFF